MSNARDNFLGCWLLVSWLSLLPVMIPDTLLLAFAFLKGAYLHSNDQDA